MRCFDPDFALWGLGTPEVEAALRRFLLGQGKIELVAHDNTHLERYCPRFLRLLKDFSHAIECRVTNRSLRQLTDSFCIADEVHIVRRFHCAHLRGEAAFDSPDATSVSAERFAGIWTETEAGLHAGISGL
ncbi:MAG TPA: hypothetical protein DCW29_16060 [Janthinobacterium sp.]|nr:hypothetical protein [Janthinobacterium sp.]